MKVSENIMDLENQLKYNGKQILNLQSLRCKIGILKFKIGICKIGILKCSATFYTRSMEVVKIIAKMLKLIQMN